MACSGISYAGYRRALNPSSPPRERVFLITLDTTRADHLGAYGYPRNTSPNFDRYAAEGVKFNLAICQMGGTDPSHSSMFTGTYPRTHGVVGMGMHVTGPVASLPEYFLDRGFRTAAVISRTRLYPSLDLHIPGFEYENAPGRGGQEAGAPSVFRRAADWLARHRDENVFMWIHFFDPHHPYQPHPDGPARFGGHETECHFKQIWPRMDEYIPDRMVEKCRDLYDEEIAFMDFWLGRTVEWIRNLEPRPEKEPIFIILADHGELLGEYQHLPEHYGFGHGPMLFNAVIRIPFIICSPGRVPGKKVISEVTETVDIAPTLIELVFGRNDFPGQGQNLMPLIAGTGKGDNKGFAQRTYTEPIPERPMLSEPAYAVFTSSYKLISGPGAQRELYDLRTDFNEKNNLASTHQEEVKRLSRELETWMRNTPETKPAIMKSDRRKKDTFKALGYIIK